LIASCLAFLLFVLHTSFRNAGLVCLRPDSVGLCETNEPDNPGNHVHCLDNGVGLFDVEGGACVGAVVLGGRDRKMVSKALF
jgi:hypothetical protein